MSAAAASPQTGLKRVAGALAFVCLVLFLLAIEQKQAVAAWQVLRDEAGPAAARIVGWVGQATSGAGDGWSGLRQAVAGPERVLAPAPGDAVLTGVFAPADLATRETIGTATFIGADIRLESGQTLSTRPLRIATARESFTLGQTFADRLDAPAGAQIELRRVVASDPGGVPAASLCQDRAPGVVALLHRGDRVDLVLFRERTIVGPDAPTAALCGVWSFHGR